MSIIYKFILEKKIKLSIIFSFILILILIGFQLQKFWKEFNDLKIINNQQSQRIKDLNNDYEFTVNKIKNDYNLNFLSKCSNLDYLTDKDLSLKIDNTNKKIYYDKIFKILNFNSTAKVVDINFDPISFKDDIDVFKKVKIEKFDRYFTIKLRDNYKDNSAHQIELQVLINDSLNYCKQNLRLFLSPSINLPRKWKIFSVIGKSGMKEGYFSLPYGTEFFENNLWTTDCSNENVSVFDLNGHYINSFSKYGKKIGELDFPADIKIRNGKIYVVEEKNHRIQVFNLNGEPIKVFGSYGETNDYKKKINSFNNPLGISVTKNQIVVTDWQNERLLSYDHDFNFLWSVGNEFNDAYKINNPYYVEYSNVNKHFIFSNQSNSEIGILDENGKKIRSFGSQILKVPFELAVSPIGDLLVSDTIGQQVVIFDGKKNYNIKNVFKFPSYLGTPKTVTSVDANTFLVGFVGNGSAYFLVISKNLLNLDDKFKYKFNVNFKFSEKNPLMKTSNYQTKILYEKFCSSCHENGRYSAPARGNVEAWKNVSHDIYELLHNTIKGKGSMIPRGGCSNCSNKELKELINFMLPKSW